MTTTQPTNESETMSNKIEIGTTVEGTRCGTFLVTGRRTAGSTIIIDVREIGPNGRLGKEIGMTPECFK